ncbi:MAG: glycerophosphodiester phosphodiesterase [Bacteroidaceae bacterium]|nr:glycerophosphodiester phosphodiesterase [Bacteroidaceae bacterium]
MIKKTLISALALVACIIGIQAQTQVIAHRGFWKTEGSAQNSIAALEKAAEERLYGSEFDVQVTLDGKLIVNHDAKFQGFVIAETPFKELKKIKLKNGEKLPTLKKYLKAGKKQDIQLILEIKSHKSKEVEDKMAADIVKMVKKMGLQKQVEYIAFSLNICEQLAKLTPESEIAYLNGNLSPAELKKKGINGIDYNQKVLEKHPEWVEEAHRLGMKVNVWTVNKEDMMRKFIDMKVDYITTDYPLETQKLL